jgi:hypothetical protein
MTLGKAVHHGVHGDTAKNKIRMPFAVFAVVQ